MAHDVLVADDDPIMRAVLVATLTRWGFRVTAVADGAAAWRYMVTATEPTLAIVDWMMPGLSGVDLCRRLRQERDDANFYIVLLTAREGRGDLIAGLDAGADDYVVKPFDPAELRARLRCGERVLSLRHQLSERVREVQTVLASEKRLQGLVPICSYCKSIRSDDSYWHAVEAYLSEHSDVRFSHGICPPCLEKVTAEFTGST
jgi:DNA-binding response OmpR family regulator